MLNINLDKDFTPFGSGLEFSKFDFPSGCEPHIKIPLTIDNSVRITCRIKSMNDLVLLLLCVDALKRSGASKIHCFIPYLPFARQDRVMVAGEPLSLKVITDIINAQGFDSVYVFDVHSEVSAALIDKFVDINNSSLVEKVLEGKTGFQIVSPDSGAYKKIFNLCRQIGYSGEIITCNKSREVSTGNIKGIFCAVEDFSGSDLYIIDDICDGGGTFILLANELRKRNCGKVFLVVSHGIFSKGVDALEGIDHIYTTDSFKDLKHSKLTQYKLQELL